MKKLLVILLAGSLTGCGMTEDLTRRCGGYLDAMCDFVFGNDPEDIDELDDRLSNLEDQVEILEQLVDDGQKTDQDLQSQIEELHVQMTSQDKELSDRIVQLEADFESALEDQKQDLQDEIDLLERRLAINVFILHRRVSLLSRQVRANERNIRSLTRRIVQLESEQPEEIELIDPCGDGPGIDEVLFKMVTGEVVAWYKNKGLAVLGDGHYRTTDSQRCRFEVRNGEVLD